MTEIACEVNSVEVIVQTALIDRARQADERVAQMELRERSREELDRWWDGISCSSLKPRAKRLIERFIRIAKQRGDLFAEYQIAEIDDAIGMSASTQRLAKQELRDAGLIKLHAGGQGAGNKIVVELLLPK